MPVAILFYKVTDDREGIYPVNSFRVPTRISANYLKEVNFHLESILNNFVEGGFGSQSFWVEDAKHVNLDEYENYGRVYAEQVADDKIRLSLSSYEAAYEIAVSFVNSYSWGLLLDSKIIHTNYSVSDIPLKAPIVPTADVDGRFTVGEELLDSFGEVYVYEGVFDDPFDRYASEQFRKTDNGGVIVGVANNTFVRMVDATRLVQENTVEVYPLPKNYSKRFKYFTRSAAFPGVEGFGRTQKLAKLSFAFNVLHN